MLLQAHQTELQLTTNNPTKNIKQNAEKPNQAHTC